MIVCPNTSPLIVLARLEHLDLLGDPADVRRTRAVQDEIRDKQDEVAARVAELAAAMRPIVDDAASDRVDPMRVLGRGERSVLNYALATGTDVLCVLDDAAARAEARRLEVSFTGTLGLVLRAHHRDGSHDVQRRRRAGRRTQAGRTWALIRPIAS